MSFMGLLTEFPILALGTDAIMGTGVLGSVLPHTLDIKNGLLFTEVGASLQLHRRDAALSGSVFTVGHSSVPPYLEAVLHCTVHTAGGRLMPSSGLLEDRFLHKTLVSSSAELWWIHPGGGFRFSCLTSVRIRLW